MKISGVRDPENIEALCRLRPDYLAFDFRPSSPYYLGEIDEGLLSGLPEGTCKVGIFSSVEPLYIIYMAGRFSLGAVQIESDLSPQTLELLVGEGLEVIKVLESSTEVEKYEGVCHRFLVRERSVLEAYESMTPLIVDASLWKGVPQGAIVDIADGFEVSYAIKNVEKIEDWIKNNI